MYWSQFYQLHYKTLAQNYPGINETIYFRELHDIIKKNLDHSVCSSPSQALISLSEKLLRGLPFQYLLKSSEFYGMKLFVDERVLIPRPETEDLVDRLMELKKQHGRPFSSVLDVGVGSGAILLGLMNNGFAMKGCGADLSQEALSVARINSKRLRLAVEFIQSDRLLRVSEHFEVIVSNPPYIRSESHLSGVHQAVDRYEPHLALYLPDQEYDLWFQEFFAQVFNALLPHGIFAMEGHEEEVVRQAETLTKTGFQKVRVEKDLTGRDRFLFATRP